MDDDSQREATTKLGEGFPCLTKAPDVPPFRPEHLDPWAASGALHGERANASFALAVRDASTGWEAGRFALMDALASLAAVAP